MRILHFYKAALPYSYGGVEQVIDQIAQGTSSLGAEVTVLALSKNNDVRGQSFHGYSTHFCRQGVEFASTPLSFKVALKFNQLIKSADLLHYHFPYPYTDLLHLALNKTKPSIVTYHSDIVKQKQLLKLYKPLMNAYLKSVDRIVATSPNYLNSSDVLRKFASKSTVIPIGLNFDGYPNISDEKKTYWRKRVGEKYFLFIGVLRYYKGLHILIEAAQESPFTVVIVGAGPIEDELRKQVKELNLSNVIFLGFVSEEDKVALITNSYAIVFPSHLRSEAFGVSLLEGAMYGKPLISSEIGTGTSYININNETGLVVQPGDPVALRQAMGFLWDNCDIAKDMGEKANSRYQRYFTGRQMASSYYDLYREVLEE